MVSFTATLLKFADQGEKTGWTYLEVPEKISTQLKPGWRKSFRVKGKLDNHAIKAVALFPMGGGGFIMAVNATVRKGIGKRQGAKVAVQLAVDDKPLKLSADLMECLADEPKAIAFFKKLPPSHQHYYSKWIEGAKTEGTKTKRITNVVWAMERGMSYGEMMRALKKEKDDLMG
ncbi:MAG TPA: YdeI/OmpD-associated family protein [Chitinophagaceae bacterium]|jgi:hypothetical protein